MRVCQPQHHRVGVGVLLCGGAETVCQFLLTATSVLYQLQSLRELRRIHARSRHICAARYYIKSRQLNVSFLLLAARHVDSVGIATAPDFEGAALASLPGCCGLCNALVWHALVWCRHSMKQVWP
mmetsp:Transcript_2008/g.5278  ORF Transcript_2008/g.5278 Transcript_2008/m.5278 type:complete len:125 (+) Transcript_2008:1342-1716(+)